MNISTGGPHILLFERDQQLAGLLISEFQLAGYECHTARTAVEVFDAIARYPIRIVLVDLAQAAAARREFWVALDTQRRGRGVQVLSFRSQNIAGYGPHEFEEHSQMVAADVEVDGMLGVMNLVDAVRAHIPTLGSSTNTMPRLRTATPPPPSMPSRQAQPSSPASSILSASGTSYRSSSPSESMQAPPRMGPTTMYEPPVSPPVSPPAPRVPQAPPMETPATSQPPHGERIRAVLYPSQRTWTPQGAGNDSMAQDTRPAYEPSYTATSPSPTPTTSADVPVLQRLANGQVGAEDSGESGLAQLSRLIQDRQAPLQPPPVREQFSTENGSYHTADALPTEPPSFIAPTRESAMDVRSTGTVSNPPPSSRPAKENEHTISVQPLRALPMQDMPVERASSGQQGSEGMRRVDAPSRTNHVQQAPVSLSSLTSAAPVPPTSPSPAPTPPAVSRTAPPRPHITEEDVVEQDAPARVVARSLSSLEQEKEEKKQLVIESIQEAVQQVTQASTLSDESTIPNNAVILDIVQSLPPMSSPPPQTPQPQVLNGRATRSLGSVLLEGHLVPQNRLEVAQNIQRMLRGVDLNYQLGDILLMFKLLTPDQLLAASLVSYGMITTTQISALGRIRQELHAIGLEYDLENLLILFRILTPEQLREVRSGWQG